MSTEVDARNPTCITLTQEQKDRSMRESYWDHAIRYGLEYYVAGRFAIAHHFIPVGANILHHAVEMLLKACLAKLDGPGSVREYGHRLVPLWQDFKRRCTVPVPDEFELIIQGLDAFEEIRYPERLIRDGARITIDVFNVEAPPLQSNGMRTEKSYSLKLPQVDRLMGLLFEASGANPPAFLPRPRPFPTPPSRRDP